MRAFRSLVLVLLLGLAPAACRLESHPPAGVPADEAAIRSAVAAWLAREQPWARVLRSDIRQQQNLATVWVVSSPPAESGDGERSHLLVLRREAGGWTVVFHDMPTAAKR